MGPSGGMSSPNLLGDVRGAIVVALSGGPDSAAAAAVIADASVSVRCVHVDHGLAGSKAMRSAAEAIASALDLDLEVLEIQPSSSSETALREARYQALLERLEPGETLVTAHTSDDQAETVLINLFRGAGPAGLSGIPTTRGPIVRPFLESTKSELRRIAIDRRLPFVDDPENESDRHLRSRIRTELIPLIERDYQPAIRVTLERTARNMADAASLARRAVSRVPMERAPEGVRAPIGRLVAVDSTVRRQVIREMLKAVRPPRPPSEAEVGRVEQVIELGGQTELEDTSAIAFVSGPWLYVATKPEIPGVEPLRSGTVWGDIRFTFGEPEPVRISRWRYVTSEVTLWVRRVESDDVISIREGSKSAVASIRERGFRPESHPVVVDDAGEIVWIPGVRHEWRPSSEAGGSHSGYLEIVADQDSPWEPFEP